MHATLDAMSRYGGNFAKALATCYRAADDHNQRRLRDAFEDYFDEYREIARLHAERVKAHD